MSYSQETITSLSDPENNIMQSEAELMNILDESSEDVRAGRTAPLRETFDELRELLREDIV